MQSHATVAVAGTIGNAAQVCVKLELLLSIKAYNFDYFHWKISVTLLQHWHSFALDYVDNIIPLEFWCV